MTVCRDLFRTAAVDFKRVFIRFSHRKFNIYDLFAAAAYRIYYLQSSTPPGCSSEATRGARRENIMRRWRSRTTDGGRNDISHIDFCDFRRVFFSTARSREFPKFSLHTPIDNTETDKPFLNGIRPAGRSVRNVDETLSVPQQCGIFSR